MTTRIGVVGAGSWGTALADLLARRGHRVTLWAFEPEVVAGIRERHENPIYLAGRPLAAGLETTSDIGRAVAGAALVVMATPSHVFRATFLAAVPSLAPQTIVVSATKGIEHDTLAFPSEIIAELAPTARVAVLSGPSFADEVLAGQPTAVVAASSDPRVAAEVQGAFSAPRFRVYAGSDVVGVQLAGALKNVIAIAAGILDGLGLGANTRAALITRGLAEMTRLGAAIGADPRTFAGLAGMGDLVLTTTGALSRNRALGMALAAGETLEGWRRTHRTVAEGAETVHGAVALARKHGVELPICDQVHRILYEGQDPRLALSELMERAVKAEE